MANLPGRGKPRFHHLALVVLTVALAALVLVQGCSNGTTDTDAQAAELIPAPEIGHQAPDFTLEDLAGNQLRLSDLRGKVVFLNFWAVWCPPCRAEMREVEAVHQKYKDKGVIVVGVAMAEPESQVRQYVTQGGYSWTFSLDSTGEVARDYQINAIPTSFFVDRKGVIRAMNIGAMTRSAIEAKLAKAL